MKRALSKIAGLAMALFLTACAGGGTSDFAEELPEPVPVRVVEPEPVATPIPVSDDMVMTEARSEKTAPFVPPAVEFSEYGRRVAEEFLSGFESIFVIGGSAWRASAQTVRDGERHERTGRFWVMDSDWQMVLTYEVPGIYWGPTDAEAGYWGFFDSGHNRIYEAPWLYVRWGEGWRAYNYAGYFKLFDFDGSGIPDIANPFKSRPQAAMKPR